MSRSDERRTALRIGLLAIGWLAAMFAWGCVLSFDPADPPSTTIWPPPETTHNLCGPVGARVAHAALHYLGVGAYALLGLLTIGLLAASKGVRLKDLWLRFVGLALIVTATSAAGALVIANTGQYLLPGPGGVLGAAAAHFCLGKLQGFGTTLLLTVALLVGVLLAADNLFVGAVRMLRWAGTRSGPMLVRGGSAVAGTGAAVASGVASLSGRLNGAAADDGDVEEVAEHRPRGSPARAAERAPRSAADPAEPDEDEGAAVTRAVDDEAADADEADIEDEEETAADDEGAADPEADEDAGEQAEEDTLPPVLPATRPAPVKTPALPRAGQGRRSAAALYAAPDDGEYELPPVELLEPAIGIDRASIENLCRDKAYILEQTLNEFRLEVEVVAIQTGPVITVFELKLAPGIKVSQIASLTNDMARALKAPAVRVVAPLPGKNTIGIEVPNTDKEKVRLRDVLEAAGPRLSQLAIPLFLGKDASGQPLTTDLTRMPHLLIAGTTGSGKSVCVTSIIMSILMTRTPREVNLILIDPKVVELSAYKDVPHLICPIVTDVSKAEAILEWASTKMDERYELLAEAGVRDIRSYNRLGESELRQRLNIESDEELGRIPVQLPYIIIIVDELADLMMTSAKEVEYYLVRIAQKSRAVGIHLIVSTQRPSANVITGLIKSNLPCRIAFRVSSRLDSRIVLDQNGGEVLMGQGDMLFLPPGSSKLVRAQGTFVDDEELRAVVKHAKEQGEPQFHPELVRAPGATSETGERDELFDEAVDIIVQSGRGSVSLLQRKLTIGYGRASRLIDQMYAAGLVGDYKGSQAREVLVTAEEWQAIKTQRDNEEAAEAHEPVEESSGERGG